jgi:hypothetical protein
MVESVLSPTTLLIAFHWPFVRSFVNIPPLSLGFLILKVKAVFFVKLGPLPNQALNFILQLVSQDNVGGTLLLVDEIFGFPTGWAGSIIIERTSLVEVVLSDRVPTTLQ